jgi:hypothetical protein
VNPSFMCRIFKGKGVSCYKRERAPSTRQNKLNESNEMHEKLVVTFQNRTVLVDDESYFTLKSDVLPGNDHYFTTDKSTTPPDVRHPPKLFGSGKSPPIFVPLCEMILSR